MAYQNPAIITVRIRPFDPDTHHPPTIQEIRIGNTPLRCTQAQLRFAASKNGSLILHIPLQCVNITLESPEDHSDGI